MRSVRILLPALLLAVAGLLHVATQRVESEAASLYPAAPTSVYRPGLARLPVYLAHSALASHAPLPVEFAFRPGETLGEALAGLGLEPGDLAVVITELMQHADPRRLRPEDRYAALLGADSTLRGVQLTLTGRGKVRVLKGDPDWKTSWVPFVKLREVRSVRGTLVGSLEGSIRAAGAEGVLAYEMAEVLQWDLDFTRDLRLGDRFEVLFEEVYLDGRFHGLGGILALAYENGGRRLEAYRFGQEEGYYDGEGRPLRKMFLRSPMRYSRVTSRFNLNRFHPVLRRHRPHYGVDYGAPVGTPVRVTANGVVTFAGWDRGGGGRTIKVRHPNEYLTAYLHLSRFATGIRSGRRVRQGEVIGYVGATGLVTGPHLDYRVRHHGRWIDPLKLESEPAGPIPTERLPEFLAWRDRLRTGLQTGAPVELPATGPEDRIAAADPPPRSTTPLPASP